MSFRNVLAPYVLIDGIDLSGKSSVIKRILERDRNWTRQHSSLCQHNPILHEAKSLEKDGSLWIGLVYVSALEYDIRNFSYPTQPTVQDSTILLRSLAYHKAAGYSRVLKKLESFIPSHPTFDRSYILTARPEVKRLRLDERIRTGQQVLSVNDLKIVSDPQFFSEMEAAIIDYGVNIFGAKVIDGSDLTFDEIVAEMDLF